MHRRQRLHCSFFFSFAMGFFDSLFGQPVELVWEDRTFRRGDRVKTRDGGTAAMRPDDSGHKRDLKIDAGRTGTVLRRSHGDILFIEWDAQRWEEYKGKRKVLLASFQASIHADYLDVIRS